MSKHGKSSNSTVSSVKQGLRSPANGYELRSDQPKPALHGCPSKGMIGNQRNVNSGKKK